MGYFQPKVIYRNVNDKRDNSIIRYIGNRVLRSNKNFLCLSGDTKLYGQTKTIAELYNEGQEVINTVSLTKAKGNVGTYYPVASTSEIISSGQKEVYEIELENGKKVYATAEHKLFKRNKWTFDEAEVKDLKVGDELRDFDTKWIEDFYNKANKRSYKFNTTKFKHTKECIKCNNMFYIERASGKATQKYCKTCLEQTNSKHRDHKKHEDEWFEWEDNILRNYYYDKKKSFIMNLIPNRSWQGIIHRAKKIGLSDKRRKIYNFSITKMTSIEKKVADFMDDIKVEYNFNKVIKTDGKLFFPDFTIKNLLIECDGKYWHDKKQDKDKTRQKELETLGYKVIRFGEDMINNNFGEVRKCILQELNQ